MSDSKGPRLSIVTPSFQQAKFLESTINSVLSQGYNNLEYIVIDGGSSDGSVEIIKKYSDQLTYWVSEKDSGQSDAINKGFAMATGEVLTWLNSDDVLEQGALQVIAEAYNESPNAVAWIGNADVTDADGNFLFHQRSKVGGRRQIAKWGIDAVFFQPSCFFSRAAFEQVGGLNEKLHYAMDPDLWMRLSEVGQFVFVDRTISRPRIYPECKTHKHPQRLRAELISCCVNHDMLDIAEFHLDSLFVLGRDEGIKQVEERHLVLRFCRRVRFSTHRCYRRLVSWVRARIGLPADVSWRSFFKS